MRIRHLLRLVLIAAAVLALGARPAAAHEGTGTLVLESREPLADGSVRYVVRLVWDDDGHPAVDATVTATGVAADDRTSTPVVFEPVDDDGRYAGTVQPAQANASSVRFTAITPAATLEVEETAPTTTTAAPTATSTSAVGAEASPTTIAADETEAEAEPDEEAATVDVVGAASPATPADEPEDGWGVGSLIAAAVLVVIVAAAGWGIVRATAAARDSS